MILPYPNLNEYHLGYEYYYRHHRTKCFKLVRIKDIYDLELVYDDYTNKPECVELLYKRKNMDFNLLKGTINTKSSTNIDLKNFWVLYLKLLNVYDVQLADKEIVVLAHILTNNPKNNWFKKPLNKELTKLHDNMSFPEISRLKKKLIEKEVLQKDGVISESLIEMSKIIKNNKDVNLHFYIKVV